MCLFEGVPCLVKRLVGCLLPYVMASLPCSAMHVPLYLSLSLIVWRCGVASAVQNEARILDVRANSTLVALLILTMLVNPRALMRLVTLTMLFSSYRIRLRARTVRPTSNFFLDCLSDFCYGPVWQQLVACA